MKRTNQKVIFTKNHFKFKKLNPEFEILLQSSNNKINKSTFKRILKRGENLSTLCQAFRSSLLAFKSFKPQKIK